LVDPDRVTSKLGSLEANLEGLREKQTASKEAYLTDRDLRDVVERRFEKAIQASLDIASHIVASEGYREPNDYGDLFRILEENGVLSPELADRMVEMAGFRNVLAHEYAGIDDERVYEQLQDVTQFDAYAEEVLDVIAGS
jgi:uncharacterized protein YutE (UPF0331/DUF86 family)